MIMYNPEKERGFLHLRSRVKCLKNKSWFIQFFPSLASFSEGKAEFYRPSREYNQLCATLKRLKWPVFVFMVESRALRQSFLIKD